MGPHIYISTYNVAVCVVVRADCVLIFSVTHFGQILSLKALLSHIFRYSDYFLIFNNWEASIRQNMKHL